jgi:4-hydroxybenzoate polyprenyltransferase
MSKVAQTPLLEKAIAVPTKPTRKLWADVVPLPMKPYVQLTRIDMLAGSMLVFWPCSWGFTLAAYATSMDPQDYVSQLFLFWLGSIATHSAACILNDILDIDFDRQVERCKNRPLASGAIQIFPATIFLLCIVAITVGFLALANPLAFQVGMFGIFPLHALYPLMKRWTNWPQAWLGWAMNWGVWVAYITVKGRIDWDIVGVLFPGTICWTIVYDTIYAHQDKADDVKAGIGSTAVLFGDYSKIILSFFAAIFVSTIAVAGYNNGQGPLYFIFSVLGAAAHFTWQIGTVDLDVPTSCFEKFLSNGNTIGYIILSGMIADYLHKLYPVF